MHTFDLRTQEAEAERQRDLGELKASLVYKVNCRIARATWWDTVLKKKVGHNTYL